METNLWSFFVIDFVTEQKEIYTEVGTGDNEDLVANHGLGGVLLYLYNWFRSLRNPYF